MNAKYYKKVALFAGALMLENGAETFRVEEVMKYIMSSGGYDGAEAFVTPTGIFLSLDSEDSAGTYIKRIEIRGINLTKIDAINQISRRLSQQEMDITEAYVAFQEIDRMAPYPPWLKLSAASLTAALFCLLFGGSLWDFSATILATLAMQIVLWFLSKLKPSFFLANLLGGALAAFFSILLLSLHMPINVDLVIIGAIMTLVPGVAITNSIRDTFHGDLISGTARMAEAIFIAMAIAAGVGLILNFHMM